MLTDSDIAEASTRQLEAWTNENGYEVEVDTKVRLADGQMAHAIEWYVTVAALRDRRRFQGAAFQYEDHSTGAAQDAYRDALADAVRMAKAWEWRNEP